MAERREHAFTLIEVLIVLVIVGVLSAVALGSMRGSKDAANRGKVLAAAQSYDQAISSFAADHTGRMPVPASADWPALVRGPLEPSTTTTGAGRQAYMRQVPNTVSTNVVRLLTAPPASGSITPAGSVGVVVVRNDTTTTPAVRYRVEVWPARQRRLLSANMCVLGTWQLPGDRRC